MAVKKGVARKINYDKFASEGDTSDAEYQEEQQEEAGEFYEDPEIEEEDEDDDESFYTSNTRQKRTNTGLDRINTKKPISLKLVIGAVVGVVILVVAGKVLSSKMKTNPQPQEQEVQYQQPVQDTNTGFDIRQFQAPDFNSEDLPNTTDSRVYSPDEFIKDFNEQDVSAVYNVKNRYIRKVLANYAKRRAIIDDGMEIYWVDVDYEGKKYRSQVPFYTYRGLKEKGIAVMEIEILELEGGGVVISYMQVSTETNELLE